MKRLAIALLVLVALSACVGELPADPPIDVDPNPPPAQDPEVSVEYAQNTWSYTVEANVPTPCHGVSAEEFVAESYPEQVSIVLTITEPEPDEICSQVVSRTTVEGSVDASQYAALTIRLDGTVIYEHEAQVPPSQLPPGDELACPAIYDPVCGQPPMPECPPGFACPTVMPQPRTYGNGCELGRDGATLLYEGACRDNLVVS